LKSSYSIGKWYEKEYAMKSSLGKKTMTKTSAINRDYIRKYFTNFLEQEPQRPEAPPEPTFYPIIFFIGAGVLLLGMLLSEVAFFGSCFTLAGIILCPGYALFHWYLRENWKTRYSADLAMWKRKMTAWRTKKHQWENMDPAEVDRALRKDGYAVYQHSFNDLTLLNMLEYGTGKKPGQVLKPPSWCYAPTEIALTETQKHSSILFRRKGIDGKWRFSEYNMLLIQFTSRQLCAFKCVFDLVTGTMKNIETDEINYNHVVGMNVSMKVSRDTVSGEEIITSKTLEIATSGGDKIRMLISDLHEDASISEKPGDMGDIAIKNIRAMIRENIARENTRVPRTQFPNR